MMEDSGMTWEAAMQYLHSRKLMPTELSSKELQGIAADIRRRSVFSARLTNLEVIQALKDAIADLASGKTNEATARAKLQDLYDSLGYDPVESGAVRGDLTDLSSDKRIRLQLETGLKTAGNWALHQQGQTPASRWQFPAWELVRIGIRMVPRGFQRGKGGALTEMPGDSWPERWVRAGGTLYEGRMIAAKDEEVWDTLGDSGIFDDGLDNPYPPFAFNSGMGWRAVRRSEALALGIELPETQGPQGQQGQKGPGLNDGVKVSTEGFDLELLKRARAENAILIRQDEMMVAGQKGGE